MSTKPDQMADAEAVVDAVFEELQGRQHLFYLDRCDLNTRQEIHAAVTGIVDAVLAQARKELANDSAASGQVIKERDGRIAELQKFAMIDAPLGYDASNVVGLGVASQEGEYSTWQERCVYFESFLERLRATPGSRSWGRSWPRSARRGRRRRPNLSSTALLPQRKR